MQSTSGLVVSRYFSSTREGDALSFGLSRPVVTNRDPVNAIGSWKVFDLGVIATLRSRVLLDGRNDRTVIPREFQGRVWADIGIL